MADRVIPASVDTVIVGNGPSALILSFILSGNIPYYNAANAHPDPMLHKKLSQCPCLLDLDIDVFTSHFSASRLSYSTQALPINVLLDTLLRPLADTDPGRYKSCIAWRFEEARKIQHLVLGNTAQAGGQWADNPVAASWDIEALSYAEMLSLPGYSVEEHYRRHINGGLAPEYHRPTRREVAGYLEEYPRAVGIQRSLYNNVMVQDIQRKQSGFHVGSHGISCRHLVLASGVFSKLIAPRPLLRPLMDFNARSSSSGGPLLVVGSGFTAADIILSTPPHRKIIHIFKWDPENNPSPLKACHPRAYPDYANVYRHMKLAAKTLGSYELTSPTRFKKSNPFFDQRDWDSVYEGLPNTYIKNVVIHEDSASLTLETDGGSNIEREISNIEYVIGRRGSLDYLNAGVRSQIFGEGNQSIIEAIAGSTLRSRAEVSLEMAPDVFAIGSLTGDSLIRFAYGGCVFTAREIMRRSEFSLPATDQRKSLSALNEHSLNVTDELYVPNGFSNLTIDEKLSSSSIDQNLAKYPLWQGLEWWTGGCIIS